MLAEEGIISTDVAKKILECTQEISAMEGHPTFEINPNVEDLYFNLEKYLLEQTGAEIGGQQHTARSRNDLFATEAQWTSEVSICVCAACSMSFARILLI